MRFSILTVLCSLFISTSCSKDRVDTVSSRETKTPSSLDDGVRVFSAYGTNGLNVDSKILTKALSTHLPVLSQQVKGVDKFAFINIFFEYVDKPYLNSAKYNWLVINQELSPPPEDLRYIDLVICKSRYAVELLKKMRARNSLHFSILHTKFTTMPLNGEVTEPDYNKDYSLALHAAGQSPFKGTGNIIKAWSSDPSLPKLVVSCRDYPDSRIGCRYVNSQEIFYERHIRKSPNLEIFSDEFLPKNRFDHLMTHAGLFVVTSEMEGYGHYINEGRMAGAVVITTDAPPMNELIQDGVNGILVPVHSREVYNPYTLAERSIVTPEAIKQAMNRVASMSREERLNMGKEARKSYEADTQFLRDRLARVSQSLKERGDLSGINELLE